MKRIKTILRTLVLITALSTFTGCEGQTQGVQGTQGPQGIQGEKGDQGIQGIQGPKGDQGIPGTDGTGTGKEGAQGPQGEPGKDGTDGMIGLPGPIGLTGPQGLQGERGSNYQATATVHRIVKNTNSCADTGNNGVTIEIYEDTNSNGIADRDIDFFYEKHSFCVGETLGEAFQTYVKLLDWVDIRFEQSQLQENGIEVPDNYLVEIFIEDKVIHNFIVKKKVR